MKSEITILGAGPYGLALAAHLPKISGLPFRIFGEPMSFWRDFMPKGMYLRSAWRACYIADPQNEFTLEAYQAATGEKISASFRSKNLFPMAVGSRSKLFPMSIPAKWRGSKEKVPVFS